jgi:hypothetical protein
MYQTKYIAFKILYLQASTLTFIRLSSTSENWRRTSRSCITVVRRDKWKNKIPKRAGTTDKFICTGIKYWVCCIKEPCLISNLSIIIPPLPGGGGRYTVLPLSVCLSFRPSKIFFSATIDGRNLIFGHKLHIGMPYCGKRFWDPSGTYFLFADFVDFYTHWTYMLIFRRIFLSKYWWQKSDISSHASYRYPILWEAYFDPSDADLVGFYTHLTYMHIFCRIFLSKYWWQESDIWSQASYRYPISW